MADEFHHISVLLNESVDGLAIKPNGTYVDCTLGGAGHSSKIAAALSDEGRLIAFDQDLVAIGNAEKVLAAEIESGKVTLVQIISDISSQNLKKWVLLVLMVSCTTLA